jgi:3-oxoacyl-[acyl-carrier-protein] synthase-1|tara:strand:- start:78095 stop:79237 length:1143 start_codon:yes stop_codon:yes gene_type:complete
VKTPVYISHPGLVTPLGLGVQQNFTEITNGNIAIQKHSRTDIAKEPFYAAMVSEAAINEAFKSHGAISEYTKLEKMMLLSALETLDNSEVKISDKTLLIVATTKGNIDVLDKDSAFNSERAYLPNLAKTLGDFLGVTATPVVISNACVSGILAVAVAKRLISSGGYDNALILSGDLVSRFTLSGFQSFQAISDLPCKPYSKYRNGITLGEAASSVFVSTIKPTQFAVQVLGDGSCNDANHISGPSRTGEGLFKSVQDAMKEAKIDAHEVDFISAHGTATIYNDEMEAIAFNRAALHGSLLHSLKGIFGHTLGASGLLETVIALEMMKQELILPSTGFDTLGVSKPLAIVETIKHQPINILLKTASGFGGCNTAVVFKKVS